MSPALKYRSGEENTTCVKPCKKTKSRGASLRGQGTPAYPARLRSERVGRPWNCKLKKIGAREITLSQLQLQPSYLRRRGEIRSARLPQRRQQRTRRAVRCAEPGRGNGHEPVRPE